MHQGCTGTKLPNSNFLVLVLVSKSISGVQYQYRNPEIPMLLKRKRRRGKREKRGKGGKRKSTPDRLVLTMLTSFLHTLGARGGWRIANGGRWMFVVDGRCGARSGVGVRWMRCSRQTADTVLTADYGRNARVSWQTRRTAASAMDARASSSHAQQELVPRMPSKRRKLGSGVGTMVSIKII